MIAATNELLKVQAHKSGENVYSCLTVLEYLTLCHQVIVEEQHGFFFHLGGIKSKTGWKQVNVHQYLSFWSCVVWPGTVTL